MARSRPSDRGGHAQNSGRSCRSRQGGRAFGLTGMLVGTLVGLGLVSPMGTGHAFAEAPAGSGLVDGQVGAVWMSIGSSPSRSDVVAAADRYQVVVLNAWDTDALALLKSLNPAIVVLEYKDLASTRSDAVHGGVDDPLLPAGVGYVEADPSWFAVDTEGQRIEWAPKYPAHWQMKVWDVDYQNRWVSNVSREVVANGWDGVFADNDMWTLGYYSSALFEGTFTQEETDTLLRSGLASLVAIAGSRLNADGKLFIPNLGDGRLDLDRWHSGAVYGGAMDEQFAHWGSDPVKGFVTDWRPTGWIDQTSELTAPLSLLITHSAADNNGALRYGYGSALMRATGRVAWTGETNGRYTVPEWFRWQDVPLGAPTSVGQVTSSGAWVRSFQNGLVLVNPTTAAITTRVATSYCRVGGNEQSGEPDPGGLTVPAHDALLFTTC